MGQAGRRNEDEEAFLYCSCIKELLCSFQHSLEQVLSVAEDRFVGQGQWVMFELDHFVLATVIKGVFKNCRSVWRKNTKVG